MANDLCGVCVDVRARHLLVGEETGDEMSLAEEFFKYRDRYGLNQLTSSDGRYGDVSQNGALFTMEYLICLMEDPATPIETKLFTITRLRAVYDSLEIMPGLTLRTPESWEGDSMDNVGSTLSFSGLFDEGRFARRMRDHGLEVECTGIEESDGGALDYYPLAWFLSDFKRPKNFWNNANPQKFCLSGWWGRSPGFMGLVDLAATNKTTWFRYLAVFVGQFLGCFSDRGNTDARKLPYVIWYFLRERSWVWKLGYWLWVRILLWQYPNGMRDVYSIYYQDPNHPIRTRSKRYFGETT